MEEIKSHKIKIFMLLSITLIMFITIIKGSSGISHTKKNIPLAAKGVLDLRNWDFKKDGMIKLNGEWEFYDNELHMPQDFQSIPEETIRYEKLPGTFGQEGYCTYRLKLLIDNKKELYSVKINFIQNAYELWANNKLITSAGRVGKSKNEMIPENEPASGSFYVENDETYLVLRVSNFYNKYGYVDTLVLGESKEITAIREQKLALSLFIIGCTIMAAIYSFGLFINRRKEKAQLYFSIICLIIAIRTLFIGQGFFFSLFPHLNYIFSTKMKIWTFYAYIPFIILFIDKSYEKIMSRKVVKVSNYLGVVYTLSVIFTPVKYYLYFIAPFELSALALLFYMMCKICKICINNKQTDHIVVVGLFALFITRINDILYEYSIIITDSFASQGILIFIVVNYYVLAKRQANELSNIESSSAKLKSLNELKDDFLAVTSHELKTPLNGIVGLTEGIVNNKYADLDVELREDLFLVNSSAKRLSNLVNDMMIFSKLKNNQIVLRTKFVNISNVVEMVIKFSEISINNKNVTFKNLIDKDTPYVFGDEDRIQQILYNLLSNAIKFTHEGEIILSYIVKNSFVEICVTDTGIGIPEQKLHKIFSRYEQVDGIAEKYGGTGVGLYVTKELIQIQGGTIKVSSVIGEGSKFIFTLPLCTEEELKSNLHENLYNKENEETAELLAQYSNNLELKPDIVSVSIDNVRKIINENINSSKKDRYKVLIVDDEYVNLKVLKNYLSNDTFEVLEASSGKEALRIIDENVDLDLVILDMMMPDISGNEVCAIIREEQSIFELPVLIMTADSNVEHLVISFECGANDYLSKPFNMHELLCRINTLITLKDSVKKALALVNELGVAKNQVEALSVQNAEASRQVEELIAYDKVKTDFLTNMSHELRTPLNVICSTIQLLKSLDGAKNLGDEKIKYYINIMNQNSLRLLRLINNIIDTNKIEADYISLNLKNGDIVYVVEEISQSVAEYIKSHEITLIFDTDVEEKIIAFDEEKIERIMLNLLSNAVKFTDKKGSILVNIYDKGGFIEISVKDTGIGIPKGKLEFVFERFAQIDKSTSRHNEGSGIGLALVKSLVEMHEGSISVNSEGGKGSEFIINLPVRTVDREEEENNLNNKEVFETNYEQNLSIEFSDIYK
ncbi:response regulator [Clostridium sp. CF011]|uniref:ATP-binding protein n=1 Tax=Clostridium sp. CF011 TaxID=2843318 RepID=UPI001C0B880D|nr:ATP-binding protein [Clostridium sp. CF011]MBU3092091.1 response regulator [Clostridium sp. CF011]WAG71372.1 response regulator [Clostridium sp. CF011]